MLYHQASEYARRHFYVPDFEMQGITYLLGWGGSVLESVWVGVCGGVVGILLGAVYETSQIPANPHSHP